MLVSTLPGLSRLLGWLQEHFIPLTLALLVSMFMLAFIAPPTGREALDGHDLVEQQYPLLSLIFDSVRDGHGLPLWNPYLYAGQSIVANPQSTIFYPPAWIMVPLGVPRGVGWLIVLHLWIGAWGMAQFSRRLGASPFGALVGGIVYGFSAVISAHLGAGHLNYLLCQAWLPWIATAFLWSIDRPRWLLLGIAAFGLSILAGYPPLLYFVLLWLGALWLYLVAAERISWIKASRALLLIVGGGVILGAALLLPVGEFTLRSTRTQASSLEFSNSYALPGGQLVTFLFPNFFGQPRLPEYGYWGLPFYEEVTGYVGILPLVALLLSLSLKQRKAAMLLAIFAAAGLVVSLGIDGGLFPTLYRLLPGYSLFRVPSRALYFTMIGAAGLTALLVTELQANTDEERARLLRPALRRMLPAALVIAILVCLALTGYFTIHSTDEAPPWRAFYSGSMAGLAIVSICLTGAVLRAWVSSNSRWIRGFVVLVVVFDLWHISQLMVGVSAIDVPLLWQTVAHAVPASPDYRVMTVPYNVSWQAGAVYTRHLNANGYDPLVSSATQRLLDASQQNPTSPVARLLGVRYAISDKPYEWSKLTGIEQLSLLTQDGDWRIYQTRDPLPRAFVVANSTVLADDLAIQQLMSGNFDPGSAAIIDHPVNCPSEGTLSAAKITRYEPNTVEVSTNQAGILVLSDSYDSAWTVTVDGAPAELLRVYTALRGVCVPGGSHSVRFEYRPAAFTGGLVISAAGWLAWIIAAVIAALEAKRKQTA